MKLHKVANQFLTDPNEIKQWLDSMRIKNYTINPDGVVDVRGHVDISYKNLTRTPVRFGKVDGNVWCNNNQLKTLKGAPRCVGGSFSCYSNQLRTLEGGPREVDGDFLCYGNQLETLKGAPHYVSGRFSCRSNQLKTLEGAPQKVGGKFDFENNKLISNLFGIHKQIQLVSHHVRIPNTVKSNILGLMLIENISSVVVGGARRELQQAVSIINKHLQSDRDPMLAQRELMKAGLREFARY